MSSSHISKFWIQDCYKDIIHSLHGHFLAIALDTWDQAVTVTIIAYSSVSLINCLKL